MNKIFAAIIFSLILTNYVFAEPNWVNDYIYAEGIGLVQTDKYPASRAKLIAKRAAAIDGRKILLEKILNLKLESGKLIKDRVRDEDKDVLTSGLIQSAELISDSLADRQYKIKYRIELRYVYNYLVDEFLDERIDGL